MSISECKRLYGQSICIGLLFLADCMISFIDQRLGEYLNQTWGSINRKLKGNLIGINDILTANSRKISLKATSP